MWFAVNFNAIKYFEHCLFMHFMFKKKKKILTKKSKYIKILFSKLIVNIVLYLHWYYWYDLYHKHSNITIAPHMHTAIMHYGIYYRIVLVETRLFYTLSTWWLANFPIYIFVISVDADHWSVFVKKTFLQLFFFIFLKIKLCNTKFVFIFFRKIFYKLNPSRP